MTDMVWVSEVSNQTCHFLDHVRRTWRSKIRVTVWVVGAIALLPRGSCVLRSDVSNSSVFHCFVWTNPVLTGPNHAEEPGSEDKFEIFGSPGFTPVQCWRQLQTVYGEECMSKPTVQCWHKKFRQGDGLTPVTDELRSGRPRSKRTPEKVNQVSTILQDNGCKTIKQVSKETGLTWSTTQKVVKRDLKLSRKAAKFIPKILSDEQK